MTEHRFLPEAMPIDWKLNKCISIIPFVVDFQSFHCSGKHEKLTITSLSTPITLCRALTSVLSYIAHGCMGSMFQSTVLPVFVRSENAGQRNTLFINFMYTLETPRLVMERFVTKVIGFGFYTTKYTAKYRCPVSTDTHQNRACMQLHLAQCHSAGNSINRIIYLPLEKHVIVAKDAKIKLSIFRNPFSRLSETKVSLF